MYICLFIVCCYVLMIHTYVHLPVDFRLFLIFVPLIANKVTICSQNTMLRFFFLSYFFDYGSSCKTKQIGSRHQKLVCCVLFFSPCFWFGYDMISRQTFFRRWNLEFVISKIYYDQLCFISSIPFLLSYSLSAKHISFIRC